MATKKKERLKKLTFLAIAFRQVDLINLVDKTKFYVSCLDVYSGIPVFRAS